MIKTIYNKYIGEKLFTKIILTYTFIIVLTLMTLSWVILRNYTNSITMNALNHCTQVTKQANAYFSQKIAFAKRIQQLPYYHEKVYGNVLLFCEDTYDTYSLRYIAHKNTLDQYFIYMEDLDPNISLINAYLINSKVCYAYVPHNSKNASERTTNLNVDTLTIPSSSKCFAPMLIPTNQLLLNENINSSNLTLAFNLRSKDLARIVGTIFVTFDLKELSTLLQQDTNSFESDLIIFDLKGNVLYDPSNLSANSTDFNFKTLKNASSDIIKNHQRITTLYTDSDLGIIIACTIENSAINAAAKVTKNVTYFITGICILASLILSCICMSFFSKRIQMVCKGILQIKEGNFKERIHIGKTKDELSLIATHFNYMCDSLETYINKVYQSGLMQKDAELKQKIAEYYALQSQVDPHFLFNTLEAIRMSALSSTNPQVSQMIYKLGSLFRSSMHQGMFISLRNEIDYCKAYLELLQLRYGEYLIPEFNIDDALYSYDIIKHLLQPLIENAVIHGMDIDQAPLTIQINGQLTSDIIEITIQDNGQGISKEKLASLKETLKNISNSTLNISANATINHNVDNASPKTSRPTAHNSVGLINLQQRIKLIYGAAYDLQITSQEGQGTKVTLKIPAKTEKELKHYVQSYVS